MSAQPSPGHFKDFYALKGRLGKGAYAVVYSCVHNETGTIYAVKVVDKTKAGPKDIDDLAHEINIMDRIGYHPHVVQMFEWFATERHLYIVMDLLEGGMLFDHIVQLQHYSEQNASELTRNLLSALAHIHSKGIIHRDLKPENLLLRYSKEQSPESHLTDVCLADFGLAGYVPSTTCCGSPSYIAPEVIQVGYLRTRSEAYNDRCDIWSLGVIAYILLSGKMPFHGSNFKETFQRIVENRWSFQGDAWERVSPNAREFIKVCLTPDPHKRPSAEEMLKHAWVAEAQPDVHLQESLDSLKKFTAQQKVRAAVRVFCWTQGLLGHLDRTPPFMRYLRHEDKYSTVVIHQSQTDPNKVHRVDFAYALKHSEPGWRIQDCCTCTSDMVCRHIQNVHEYLFVGKRSMEVFPFIDELKMMREEAEDDVRASPKDKKAQERLTKVNWSIEAACVFSDELAKVPSENMKPNLLIDGTRNHAFRATGGSRSSLASPPDDDDRGNVNRAARLAVEKMKQRRAADGATANPSTAPPRKSPQLTSPARAGQPPLKPAARPSK